MSWLWANHSLRVFFLQMNITHSCHLQANLDLHCGTSLSFSLYLPLLMTPHTFSLFIICFSILPYHTDHQFLFHSSQTNLLFIAALSALSLIIQTSSFSAFPGLGQHHVFNAPPLCSNCGPVPSVVIPSSGSPCSSSYMV